MEASSGRWSVSAWLVPVLAVLFVASALGGGEPPAVAAACGSDLAARLGGPVQEVRVVEAVAKEWPDAALGLPRPGRMYAQVVTPGWRIVLSARQQKYLYCAGDRAFEYGGPLDAWCASALYLAAPAESDGNLNRDLCQISLAGTNPTLLIPNVDRIDPQADGSIFATRRTSRSGFDLLYLAPGEANAARTIDSAFEFGEAVLSPEGKSRYGFVRRRLGSAWLLEAADFPASDAGPRTFALPDLARPGRLVLEEGRFYAHLFVGETDGWYRLDPGTADAGWERLDQYRPPDPFSLVLNKSESLSANVDRTGEKPVTEIVRAWFTGEEKPVAKIGNFEMKKMALVAGRFALVEGLRDGASMAFTVDIGTGEVLPCVPGPADGIRPFERPPHGSPCE